MTANLELIRRTYEGSSEENGRNLLAALSSDVEWMTQYVDTAMVQKALV